MHKLGVVGWCYTRFGRNKKQTGGSGLVLHTVWMSDGESGKGVLVLHMVWMSDGVSGEGVLVLHMVWMSDGVSGEWVCVLHTVWKGRAAFYYARKWGWGEGEAGGVRCEVLPEMRRMLCPYDEIRLTIK